MPEPIWVNTSSLPPIFDLINRDDAQQLDALLGSDPLAVRAVDTERRTALHWACAQRRTLVPLLLQHGADPALQDEAGWSSLHIAAAAASGEGGAEVFRSLLDRVREQGTLASVLAATTRTGATPLLLAASKGNLDVVRDILNSHVPIDLNKTDIYGNSALMKATTAGHAAIVRLLLESGARVSVVNQRTGQHVLHMACAEGRAEIISILSAHTTEDMWEVRDREQKRPWDLLPPELARISHPYTEGQTKLHLQ
jgi:26S proteasome non-ATPase regulatory subunit 10